MKGRGAEEWRGGEGREEWRRGEWRGGVECNCITKVFSLQVQAVQIFNLIINIVIPHI